MPTLSLEQVYDGLPTAQERAWAYNALDCTGTVEIANELRRRLTPEIERTYAFERACQAPAMAMMLRGVRVNIGARDHALETQTSELGRLTNELNQLPELERWDGRRVNSGSCRLSKRKDGKHSWPRGVPDTDVRKVCTTCGEPRLLRDIFNPGSPKQCAHFFYDLEGVHPQRNKKKEITCDDEAIERIGRLVPRLRGVCDSIRACRDAIKQIGFLSAPLRGGSRYCSTFNVGAAWTFRWSSSKWPIGRIGGNLQNISEVHRHIFIPDHGRRMGYADLKTAESNAIAHLSGDEAYIEAHRVGDPHTYVARLIWPDVLPWTGDLRKDKALAKSHCPPWDDRPGHDYRFQAKRMQHGSNLGLTPRGIAMKAHIPVAQAEEGQGRYFARFPGIRAYQEDIRAKVLNQEAIYNPFGTRVMLFGRPWDEHTYKQGLAFQPQSIVCHVIAIAAWRLWRYYPDVVELLAQVHDALLYQYPTELDQPMRAAVRECLTVPIPLVDITGKPRTLTIDVEAAVGMNWGHKSPDNPEGIEEIEL